ncbi:MAG: hypothetical protein Q8920_02265 [Bacillota bacterium]|nr:hypothetical protein [Bacillota bacterium]
MSDSKLPVCPVCNGKNFTLKYEAVYVYSYTIDSNAPGLKNDEEFLPFLFDARDQKETQQYLECLACGAKYPCYFNQWNNGIGVKELKNAVNNKV